MTDWHEDTHPFLSRKEQRQERKRRSQKDQSQFTKKNQSRSSLFAIPDSIPSTWEQGSIYAISPLLIDVYCPKIDRHIYCKVKGSFKHSVTKQKNIAVVGDEVLVEPFADGTGVIQSIYPRCSSLSRSVGGASQVKQCIAANIEQLFITISIKEPKVTFGMVDRFLIAAQQGGITPFLVINKIDLLTSPEEKELLADFQKDYQAAGIECLMVSAETKEGCETLFQKLKAKVSTFAGPSGTGKSSLLSFFLGRPLKVGQVAKKTGKGAHTTTRGESYPLPSGGRCIDTPGIKSFALDEIEAANLQNYYADISALRTECRFPNCLHQNEPGCRVLEAVEAGSLSINRYDSYLSILEGIQNPGRSR